MSKVKSLRHFFADTAIRDVLLAAGLALGTTAAGTKVRIDHRKEGEEFGVLDIASAVIFNCIVICGFGSVLLRREAARIAKPIEDVNGATERIAHGDFTVRVEPDESAASIEELSALTENFNEMASELEGMDYLRRDFMSNVSHELKTPIAAIAGFAELLENPDLSPEERAEYAELTREQALRLSTLCENMLNMSRLSNQEIVVRHEEIRLDEQLRKVVIALLEKWSDRDVEFDLKLPEMTVITDPGLLEQVWTNLLDNAIKYSPDGSTIHVTCREPMGKGQEVGHVKVYIRDEGIGIPSEKLPKIFDQFYQCEESHKQTGHGLGLAITKRIVELLHASIDVQSVPGEGSSFVVTL